MAARQLREVLAFIGLDLVEAGLDLPISLSRDDSTADWFLADGSAVAARSGEGIRALACALESKLAARDESEAA